MGKKWENLRIGKKFRIFCPVNWNNFILCLCLQQGSCFSIFSFICMFCRSLFVLLYFFFWPLCCLFFLDIQILITPLISSSSSYNIFLISFTFFVVGHAKLLISEIKHWISWADLYVIFQWEIVLKTSQKLQT